MRLFLLTALFLFTACTERALDGREASDGADFAQPSDGGATDLPGFPSDGPLVFDGPFPYDLAVPEDAAGVDLALPSDLAQSDGSSPLDGGVIGPGVYCSGMTCGMGQLCCGDPSSGALRCVTPTGPQSCGTAVLLCDGPEDCNGNRVCVARFFGGNTQGTPTLTRCRGRNNVGNSEYIVCRTNADCAAGTTCKPQQTTTSGAPSLSLCR